MKVSRETHTLLEINNHSMAPIRHKTVAAPNNLELLQLAKKYETPVIFRLLSPLWHIKSVNYEKD